MHIKNQVVLVTGGARGLGLAITHALINEGARVVVNYLNSQAAAQTLAQQYPEQVLSTKQMLQTVHKSKVCLTQAFSILDSISMP